MSQADDGDALNEAIDKELISFFALYDEAASKYGELCENIRHGHLFLSKARYAMGPTVLGPLSFDLSTKGLFGVSVLESVFFFGCCCFRILTLFFVFFPESDVFRSS